MVGDVPELVDVLKQHGTIVSPGPDGYDDKQAILAGIFSATEA